MKSKILSILALCLFLAIFLAVPVSATAQLNYITDLAQVLTEAEWSALDSKAADISEEHGCGMYIVILNDYKEYYESSSIDGLGEAFYDNYTLGLGADKSATVLVLSIADRDYDFFRAGYGNQVFTKSPKDQLIGALSNDLNGTNWANGISGYLEKGNEILSVGVVEAGPLSGIFYSFILAVIVAAIVGFLLINQLKSVFVGAKADRYLSAGDINFTLRQDKFTHATTQRVKIESKTSSSSGGGGRSSSSGKF